MKDGGVRAKMEEGQREEEGRKSDGSKMYWMGRRNEWENMW